MGAALAMTALVDVATWALAGYFDYAARRSTVRTLAQGYEPCIHRTAAEAHASGRSACGYWGV